MHRGLQPVDLRIIEELWKVIIKERNPSIYIILFLKVLRLSVVERARENFLYLFLIYLCEEVLMMKISL